MKNECINVLTIFMNLKLSTVLVQTIQEVFQTQVMSDVTDLLLISDQLANLIIMDKTVHRLAVSSVF